MGTGYIPSLFFFKFFIISKFTELTYVLLFKKKKKRSKQDLEYCIKRIFERSGEKN